MQFNRLTSLLFVANFVLSVRSDGGSDDGVIPKGLDGRGLEPICPCVAGQVGMAVNENRDIAIFDIVDPTIVCSHVVGALPPSGAVSVDGGVLGDCSIRGSMGFATNFRFDLSFIDLSNPCMPVVDNKLDILATKGLDTAVSADGKYLLVCSGSFTNPVSVIDIESKTQVSTFDTGGGCNSVDVCSDGTVLIDVFQSENIIRARKLSIDGSGTLTDTGRSIGLGRNGRSRLNVVCSPDSFSAVSFGGISDSADLVSFEVSDMSTAGRVFLAGGSSAAISGAFAPDGSRLYVKTRGQFIQSYEYDQRTGEIGGLLFSVTDSISQGIFGIDQLAITPDGAKLVTGNGDGGDIQVFDATSGESLGLLGVDVGTSNWLGICFDYIAPRVDCELSNLFCPAPVQISTRSPTSAPTSAPTSFPTASPTPIPTAAPTDAPTAAPTSAPTDNPTPGPTPSPTIPDCCLPGTAGSLATNFAANGCQGFVTCLEFGGSVTNYGYTSCQGNLLFDSSLGVCNYPENVDCNNFCAFDVNDASRRHLQKQEVPTGRTVRGKSKSNMSCEETVEKLLETKRKLSVAEARLAGVHGQLE